MENVKDTDQYLVINQEQIRGKGEDFFLFEEDQRKIIMGVFDGCGGSGARVYPAFKGFTGAKVAARALAAAVKIWFQDYMEGSSPEKSLKVIADKMLSTCREKASSGQALLHCLKGLHHAGIVHADIKLDNVIFRKLPSGRITGKVIDFDNSFWEKQPPAPDEEILGDPVYMAPETFLMMEEEEGKLTAAIDVFALGLVFHQIFTGKLPEFDHEKYDYAFEAVLDGGELIYSREIPELWRNIIIAMTEKDVRKRMTLDDAEKIWKGKKAEPSSGIISTMGNFFSSAGDL